VRLRISDARQERAAVLSFRVGGLAAPPSHDESKQLDGSKPEHQQCKGYRIVFEPNTHGFLPRFAELIVLKLDPLRGRFGATSFPGLDRGVRLQSTFRTMSDIEHGSKRSKNSMQLANDASFTRLKVANFLESVRKDQPDCIVF